MKRILIYGMTLNPGGIESYLLNLTRNINHANFVLDFITDFPDVAYRRELEAEGSYIYTIPPKGKHLLKHCCTLIKLLLKHPEYSICYFNLLDAGGAVTAFIPWIMGRKIIVHSHNSNTDKQRLHKLFKPLLLLITSRYVTCSDSAGLYMFGSNAMKSQKVLKIPNAIKARDYIFSISEREKVRSKLDLSDKFVICHVGRISNQKNPFGLIRIFESVHKKNPHSILLYIGTGELEHDIKQFVIQKSLDNAVMFMGNRSDVSSLLQASDIFLLPSFYEGLSIALIEAQASGLPCIVSEATYEEADCTGLLTYLSTKDAPHVWADKILSMKDYPRRNTLQDLQTTGFDTSQSYLYIQKLEKLFIDL